MNIIKERLPVIELLCGLAEEAAELAQAALKLRRVFDGTNPTPATEEQAIEHLYEEIADPLVYIRQIDINFESVDSIIAEKEERWKKRLEGVRNEGQR